MKSSYSSLPTSTDPVSLVTLASASAIAYVVFHLARTAFKTSRASLNAIPSVGVPWGPFGFYVGAWNVLKNGRAVAEEGYLKYRGKAFKIPLANRWLVILSGPILIDDIRKAPESSLSLSEGTNSVLHIEYTLGHDQFHDPYHIGVLRTTLTRNIGVRFPDIRDEVVAAFKDLIPAKSDEWTTVPAMQTLMPIISRVSNRLFIGLKCRDPDYISITTKFTQDVIKDAIWLQITPSILRPIVLRIFGHIEGVTRNTINHVGPMIQYRLDMDDKYGADWPDSERPNDLISWLLDEARGHPKRRTVRNLTLCLLNINFGAIHTTTQGLLHALYNLAANLECLEPLRAEVQSVVALHGWTKDAMGKMVKLDSFMKESSRLKPGAGVNVMRQAVTDFTFSDGTTVPAGTLIGISFAEHQDEANYTNASMFDPFRFSRMREEAGAEGTKHQMVTPSPEFLSFGIGRHACPGRFFAVNEQKLIMAHILVTYDVKLRDGVRPADEWIAIMFSPNTTAELMFRRRS